jgi:hypothetical protein
VFSKEPYQTLEYKSAQNTEAAGLVGIVGNCFKLKVKKFRKPGVRARKFLVFSSTKANEVYFCVYKQTNSV